MAKGSVHSPEGKGKSGSGSRLLIVVAVLACSAPAPDPAAVRLAALTAAAAADAIDDLQAVDDPDAAGVRDAFRNATREALAATREARDTAPDETAAAFARSFEAAEAAERLGDALARALEARSDYAAALEHAKLSAAKLDRVRAAAEEGRDLRALGAGLETARAEEAQVRPDEAKTAAARERVSVARDVARQAHDTAESALWRAIRGEFNSQLVRERRIEVNRTAGEASKADDAANRALDDWSRAANVLRDAHREINLLRSTLLGRGVPTLQEVERLEAEAVSLARSTAAAGSSAASAAERAAQAMTAAEARTDEAIAAYRAAVDAWRAMLESREAETW